MMRRRPLLLTIAVLAIGSAVLYFFTRGPAGTVVDTAPVGRQAVFRSTVTASGEVVATRFADIGSSVMGRVVRLPVREGDRVRAGQVLAQIDAVQAESAVAGARALVSALEADERASAEQVNAVMADLAAAEAAAHEASQQLARKNDLLQKGLLSPADHDAARTAAAAATAQAQSARAAVERAVQSRNAASRRVAQARAQRTGAVDVLTKTSIVSPIDGVVSRLRVREGEMVVIGVQNQPGTTLMTVSDLRQIDAEVKAAEADVLRLELGQKASVTLEALPGRVFTGAVVEIGASALPVTSSGASAREFKLVVRLDQPDPGLRPGLTCDAEIVTTERANVLTAPLQSVVIRPGPDGQDRTGVFVVEGTRARFAPVTAGVIGGLSIEVAGIQTGTEIVVGPFQVLRELADGALIRPSR
jgi:HlyD family secretion protein